MANANGTRSDDRRLLESADRLRRLCDQMRAALEAHERLIGELEAQAVEHDETIETSWAWKNKPEDRSE